MLYDSKAVAKLTHEEIGEILKDKNFEWVKNKKGEREIHCYKDVPYKITFSGRSILFNLSIDRAIEILKLHKNKKNFKELKIKSDKVSQKE